MVALLPGVSYRIENDGLGAFLHLSNAGTKDAKLKMQPMQNSQKQHWLFIAMGGNSYKIQNVASKSSSAQSGFVSVDAANASLTVTSEAEARIWNMEMMFGDRYDRQALDEHRISYSGGTFFLGLNDEGGFSLMHRDDFVDHFNPTDDFRWRIHEVVPSVHGGAIISVGTYRIRTLDGLAIRSEGNVVSTKDQTKGAFQEWDVEPVGNGRCTIKNRGNSSYLNWRDTNNMYDPACTTPTVFIWELISHGGGYVFSIRLPALAKRYNSDIYQASLVPAYNSDQIVVSLSNVEKNLDRAAEMWIFEPVYRFRPSPK